jgi:RNA polymerase sigma factor (sigma-70 family)
VYGKQLGFDSDNTTIAMMRHSLEGIFPQQHLNTLEQKLNTFFHFTQAQDHSDLIQEGLASVCDYINLRFYEEDDFYSHAQSVIGRKLEAFRQSNRLNKRLIRNIKKLQHEWFQPAPEYIAETEQKHRHVRKALTSLTPYQKDVIKQLYGIDCNPLTISEVAKLKGVSHENIRNIRDRALCKMARDKTLQSLL